ncbi:hypothetical protein HYS72_03415 [Candidatus Pacearchaeota archaeon]|nr:hypothetical protein [Candidatus Pacearchaeota archaeon]MBI2056933.1 hypothetical protein [Candidatus Pacearchaeota archaeon]
MKNLKNYLIAGITALSLLPLKSNGQKNTGESLVEKWCLSQPKPKLDSMEITVSEFRDIYGRPLSFISTYYFSDNSKLFLYCSDICKENKIREITYFSPDGKKEEIITNSKTEKKEREKFFKGICKETKNLPGGYKYTGRPSKI